MQRKSKYMAKKPVPAQKEPTNQPKKLRGGRKGTVKIPSMEGLKKQPEYLEFLTFMAVPDVLRGDIMGVRTQQEFSKKFKVSEPVLTGWKQRAGFWDDVIAVRKDFFKARTANVLLALETKSLDPNKVQGQDVRVLLTYAGEYTDRSELEHKVHPDLADALERISKVLD